MVGRRRKLPANLLLERVVMGLTTKAPPQMAMPGFDIGIPKAKKKKEPSRVDVIVGLYTELRGDVPFGKDLMILKHQAKLLLGSYEANDILACMRWVHAHQKYGAWNWKIAFVGRCMEEWRREVDVIRKVNETIVKAPPDWKPIASYELEG